MNETCEIKLIEEDDLIKFKFFETTKDLIFKEGRIIKKKSFIKKGTNFIIESRINNKYELHFQSSKENKYHNDVGDNYFFTFNEIKDFARPDDYSVEEF